MTYTAIRDWLGRRAASVVAALAPLLLFLRQPAPVFWAACMLVVIAAALTAWAAIMAPVPVFSLAALLALSILAYRIGLRLPSFASGQGRNPSQGRQPAPIGSAAGFAFFAPDMVVQGRLGGASETIVQGRFTGEIRSRSVVVDAHARVDGEVQGEQVEVFGRLFGEVECDAVHVHAGGELNAEVTHRSIIVAPGAVFEGMAISSSAERRTSPKLKVVAARSA